MFTTDTEIYIIMHLDEAFKAPCKLLPGVRIASAGNVQVICTSLDSYKASCQDSERTWFMLGLLIDTVGGYVLLRSPVRSNKRRTC